MLKRHLALRVVLCDLYRNLLTFILAKKHGSKAAVAEESLDLVFSILEICRTGLDRVVPRKCEKEWLPDWACLEWKGAQRKRRNAGRE